MSTQVLFINEARIKSLTSVNFNVSPKDLIPFIIQAQDIYMEELIGGTYYTALKTRALASSLTTADNTLLDDYIGPALVNYALFMALPFLKYKIYNKSVLSGTSENGEASDLKEIQWLQNQVKGVAENYARRLIQYLQYRSDDYPLYASPDPLDGQIPEKGSPYRSSIVTMGTRKYNKGYDQA